MSFDAEAEATLNRHLASIEENLRRQGPPDIDPREVVEDIRLHVIEELSGADPATPEEVLSVLSAMELPHGVEVTAAAPAPLDPKPRRVRLSLWWPLGFWIIGVVLPTVTILIELIHGHCAEHLFDPLPTPLHVLLVSLVPVANALALLTLKARRSASYFVRFLNGVALGVSAFYCLLFLPVLPVAVMLTPFGGIGLLPLAPYFSLLTALAFVSRLSRAAASRARVSPALAGFLAATLLPMAVNAPQTLTTYGLHVATSGDVESQRRGIAFLRSWGSDDALLRHCYERPTGIEDIAMALVTLRDQTSSEEARDVYYRVTGQPFNAVPPPPEYRDLWAQSPALGGWMGDEARGSDEVAGRILGLALAESRIDAVVDADAGHAYTEWLLTFSNDSPSSQEARAIVQLPPGGVVSRLTLWIQGEEREAAFAARSTVERAYKRLVRPSTRWDRDPALVRTMGTDRVLLQCFPVLAGGEMKVRVGITSPLARLDTEIACLSLPRFVERNFDGSRVEHAVWVDSKTPIVSAPDALDRSTDGAGTAILRGALPESLLFDPATQLGFARDARMSLAYSRTLGDEGFVVQRIESYREPSIRRLALVVDGSKHMRDAADSIARAIESMDPEVELSVLVAGDEVVELLPPTRQDPEALADAARDLREFDFLGGCDAAPALTPAMTRLEGRESSVLWIHGPQPAGIGPTAALEQVVERKLTPPRLWALQAIPGPNAIVAGLGDAFLESFSRTGSLGSDLERLATTWLSGARTRAVRERLESEDEIPGQAVETSRHLARLWAHDEVLALLRAEDTESRERAVALALDHQLVTPVTGAVVLETQEQYDRDGLKPVDPATVPSVPEPATWMLLLVSAACLGALQWKRRRGVAA